MVHVSVDIGDGVVDVRAWSMSAIVWWALATVWAMVWSTSMTVLVRVSLELVIVTSTRVSLEMATSAMATGAFGAGVVKLAVAACEWRRCCVGDGVGVETVSNILWFGSVGN